MVHTDNKRVVVVTGASRGLGREIALRFGRAADRVVVNYLSRQQEASAAADAVVRAGGEVFLYQADVRAASEVDCMAKSITERWGTIDVLVNNAGLTKDGLLVRLSEQDWDDVIDTNLKGALNCMRAVSKIMMKRRCGHIINISSIVGIQGRAGQANYASSKAGLIALTKTAAREFGRFNIKVNAVLPGYIPTGMGGNILSTVRERVINENALGRVSEPEEVADFIYHLSSMKNVSGQVFNLDSRVV